MLFLQDIYHIIGMEQDTSYMLLKSLDTPEDLRRLEADKLPEVCKELRQKIIDELSRNPGHFGSSLGVVELTVALHYVFNTPYDRIVWDVGHQAYGHKILTGRRDTFCTNRKLHGLCPFPSPHESEYDTFTCGHASNSISAALGMAVAAKKNGENNRHVVAVIGDGSMSGGLAFEGLNNASSTPNNLLIILNDNNMAIDRSVGGMKQYLLNLQMSEGYNKIRYKLSKMFYKWGILNEERRKSLIRFNNSLKSMLVQQQNVFEGMNIRYFGPIDGHDVNNLARVLKEIKDMQGPKLLHIHTTKGKGFGPAEKAATIWHAPGIFDKETGERRYEDLATDVMTFKFDKETGVCTNFSDNVTPSVQAGWAPAHIGDAETLVNEAADGHIVYYNEQWWSTPEQVWIGLNPEVVYFHDIAGDTQPVDRNAFARIKIVEEPKAEVDVDGIYDFWWLF